MQRQLLKQLKNYNYDFQEYEQDNQYRPIKKKKNKHKNIENSKQKQIQGQSQQKTIKQINFKEENQNQLPIAFKNQVIYLKNQTVEQKHKNQLSKSTNLLNPTKNAFVKLMRHQFNFLNKSLWNQRAIMIGGNAKIIANLEQGNHIKSHKKISWKDTIQRARCLDKDLISLQSKSNGDYTQATLYRTTDYQKIQYAIQWWKKQQKTDFFNLLRNVDIQNTEQKEFNKMFQPLLPDFCHHFGDYDYYKRLLDKTNRDCYMIGIKLRPFSQGLLFDRDICTLCKQSTSLAYVLKKVGNIELPIGSTGEGYSKGLIGLKAQSDIFSISIGQNIHSLLMLCVFFDELEVQNCVQKTIVEGKQIYKKI